MKGRFSFGLALLLAGVHASTFAVERCGWFDNPTPANAWLRDRDGDWTLSIQGGHEADGDWPRFKDSQWVRTGNGSAGYGCACLSVRADGKTHEVAEIYSARAQALSTCRKDAAIRKREPNNPLK